MTKIIAICLAIILLFALAACGPIPEPEVDWSKYHPSVRQRIDLMADENDCRGLQRQFDTVYENDGATRRRTGRGGNSNMMGYILDKLEGCHASSRRPK